MKNFTKTKKKEVLYYLQFYESDSGPLSLMCCSPHKALSTISEAWEKTTVADIEMIKQAITPFSSFDWEKIY